MPTLLFSQQAYISTESYRSAGVKVVEGTARDNCSFIKVKDRKAGTVTTYFPTDLDEYGLKDGVVYISRTINVNGENRRVFLKRLVEHGVSLYYYTSKDHRAFYLESGDTTLIELTNNGERYYKAILSDKMADCAPSKGNVRVVQYKQNSLKRLVSNYNTCSSKPLPYKKIGVVAGFELTGITTPSRYTGELEGNFDFGNHKGAVVGVSFDAPIDGGYFSAHGDVLLSKSGYSIHHRNKDVDTDVVINFTSLDLPLQVRYTIPTRKVQPFVNMGGVVSLRMKNTSAVYRATVGPDAIYIDEVSRNTLISNSSLGFATGAGIQFKVNLRNTVSLELRFVKTYNESDFLSVKKLGFLTSFTF